MTKNIKLFIQLGILILFGSILSNFALAAKSMESLDRIIAIVNDTVVTQSELDQAIGTIKKQMQAANMPIPPRDVMHKQVLEQLINKKLQLQLAEQMNIHLTDVDLDKAIGTIAKNNNMPVGELYQKVASQGINTKEYRKEIRDELTMQQIQQQMVGAKITITPEEVSDFMHSKSWLALALKNII